MHPAAWPLPTPTARVGLGRGNTYFPKKVGVKARISDPPQFPPSGRNTQIRSSLKLGAITKLPHSPRGSLSTRKCLAHRASSAPMTRKDYIGPPENTPSEHQSNFNSETVSETDSKIPAPSRGPAPQRARSTPTGAAQARQKQHPCAGQYTSEERPRKEKKKTPRNAMPWNAESI